MSIELPEELIFLKNGKLEQKKSTTSMNGKVCVITGTTSGIGLESVKQLASGGAHIAMVCRNREKSEALQQELIKEYGVNVDIYIADFNRLDQVRKVAKDILNNYKRIDVLINNAGMHSTTKQYNDDGIEMVFCVNHLASFLLTKLLINRLKESSPSRIIQVNSEGHRFNGLDINDINWEKRTYTGLRGYGAAKTAQLLTMWEFDDELRGSGVTINALHPGDVKTNIGSNNGRVYRWFSRNVTWKLLKDPVIAGESIYYLASSPEMQEVSGNFYHLTVLEKPAPHALNRKLGKKIWDLSMKLTGLGGERL